MNQEKLTKFIDVYREALTWNVTHYPLLYPWYDYTQQSIDFVMERMIGAIARGSFNKDGRAFKDTCKTLAIPYTYKGINAYLER